MNNAPWIAEFYAVLETDNQWTLHGIVEDEDPEGMVVHFSGLPGLQGMSTTCDSDGSFFLMVILGPQDNGVAAANTTDDGGLHAPEVYYLIVQGTP